MANAFTSTELLASLKRRGLIPTSANSFAASDFFKIVDDETQTYVLPILMSVREEFLVAYDDVTIVSGTSDYNIPERAVGSKLREVAVADGNGGFLSLSRIELDNVSDFNAVSGATNSFYLRGNKVVLVGTPTAGTLRLYYYQRPNRVVATTAVGEITALNTVTGVLTLSMAAPTTFTVGVTYDLVRGKSGFDTQAKDLTPTAVGASSITFAAANLPTGLAVGDYVCLAQETPIAQVPVELHPLLAERVTATVLHALGDEKAGAAYKVAEDMEKRILKLLTQRTEGSSRYVVNRFGVGRSRFVRRY